MVLEKDHSRNQAIIEFVSKIIDNCENNKAMHYKAIINNKAMHYFFS